MPMSWIWLLSLATTASAAVKGFNYGATLPGGAVKQQSDFEAEFTTARNLVGASGFTSARLYTMIQGPSANDPISAIPAAIKTKTSLLLGLWASAGDAAFANEVAALQKAIATYGDDFTSLVEGISVGSEDLYRISPIGIQAGSLPGTGPDTLARYIGDVRKAIAGTKLSNAPIGHVDTWTAWVDGSNKAVIDACDWLGFDGYPYFQGTMANKISLGQSLFDASFAETLAHAGGKPVWIAETGWPVSGKTVNEAVASPENAQLYWNAVGCQRLFGKINTWWFTLRDAPQPVGNPSFGIVGQNLGTTPLFDLSCDKIPGDATSSPSQNSPPTPTPTPTQSPASESSVPPSSAGGNTLSSSGPSLPPPPGSITIGTTSSSFTALPSISTGSSSYVPSSVSSSGPSIGSSGGSSNNGSSTGSGSVASSASSSTSRVSNSSPSSTTSTGPAASSTSPNGGAAARRPPQELGAGFVAIMAAILAL